MLITDKLAYVELHKAGSARVQKIFADIAGPELEGKQAALANDLAALGKPVVGYVCHPLDWYLGLWKLGCAGKGGVYKRLTDATRWSAMQARREARAKEDGAKTSAKREIPEGWGAEHARTVWYGDADSPSAFREWLNAVLTARGIRRLVNAGYSNSPLQRLAGLMTHEYFVTFVRGAQTMEKTIDSPAALVAFNEAQAITKHFVRAETAGQDFLKVIGDLGLTLDDAQSETVHAWGKDNASAREKQHALFYDAESRQLVLGREKFITQLFGYSNEESVETVGDKPTGRPAAAAPGGTLSGKTEDDPGAVAEAPVPQHLEPAGVGTAGAAESAAAREDAAPTADAVAPQEAEQASRRVKAAGTTARSKATAPRGRAEKLPKAATAKKSSKA